jgi:hypothetical protein
MRIHPVLETVKDRADTEFALQRPEHGFNLRQLHIAGPQNGRIGISKVQIS